MVNKALLMHDYCVFPGSEEETEFLRLDQFLAYSKVQFEKDWEEAFSVSSEEDSLFPELMDPSYLNNNMDETTLNLDTLADIMDSSSPMMNDELVPPTPSATPNEDNWGWEDYELAEEVIKEDKGCQEPSPSGPMTEYNFNFEEFGLNTMFGMGINPALITPEFTVAPVHTPDLNTPVMNPAPALGFQAPNVPAKARASGRRKSEHTVRDSTVSATPEFVVDVKPSLPALIPSIATTTRGKKRLLPAATAPSMAPSTATSAEPMLDVASPSPQPSKKIKKYQINDPNNSSVRNAKAAKANRDKKKQEELEMKKLVEDLKAQLAQSDIEKAELRQLVADLGRELAIERNKVSSANGLATIRQEMKEYLKTIIPPLIQQTGPLNVQMAPGLAAGQPSVLIPTMNQNVLLPQQHSQILTTHMDFQNRVLTYDYNPLLNFDLEDPNNH